MSHRETSHSLGTLFACTFPVIYLTFVATLLRTRDHLSFRFLGIPYADFPERFTYSHPYTGTSTTSPHTGTNISALRFDSPCVQVGGTGQEDCLFLNIFTPLLPAGKQRRTELKPVMFWIHGGAFTGGEGSDAISDGGNLVSRGDVVVVTINYRYAHSTFTYSLAVAD